jgi:hypothetical protein
MMHLLRLALRLFRSASLGRLAIKLLAKLVDEFAFRPVEPVIVNAHDQYPLIAPTIALELFGRATISAIAFGKPAHWPNFLLQRG